MVPVQFRVTLMDFPPEYCRINKKAIYTHCQSHRLNLSICSSCSVQMVRNVLEQIKELSYFFNLSETRQLILEKNVTNLCPDSTKHKLKDVYRTRWVERIKGMDVFQELFVPLVYTLDEMSLNINKICNSDTSAKATSFLKLLTSFDFITAMVIIGAKQSLRSLAHVNCSILSSIV